MRKFLLVLSGFIGLAFVILTGMIAWPMYEPDPDQTIELIPAERLSEVRPDSYYTARDGAELPLRVYPSEENELAHWGHMIEYTPHSVIEWEALVDESFEVDRYKNISVPTLMLAGTKTEDHPSFANQALDDLLPNARIAWMNGEGHTANHTSPGMVAKEIIEFVL